MQQEEERQQQQQQEQQQQGPDLITSSSVVVFDINHGFKTVIVKVSSQATFQFGRHQVPTAALIDHPYGTLFEVDQDTGTLTPVPYNSIKPLNEWKQDDHSFERVEGRAGSSAIRWNPNNQALQSEDIEKLREGGMGGAELVEEISKNSSTFDEKTVLAQKKFKKKKERKHVLVGCARRPTAKTLGEAYYTSKHLKKIGNLRPDALAMALCLGNVCAYQRVLVIEQSSGLVAGAVMERLGGYGECCVGRVGKNAPNLSVLGDYGFDERVGGVLVHGSLTELLGEVGGLEDRTKAFTYKGRRFAKEEEKGEKGGEEELEEHIDQERDAKRAKGGDGADSGGGDSDHGVEAGRFTSLIITATNFSQKSLLLACLPLLAPSASFVVVSPTLQPLVDTMNLIKVRGFAIAPVINEPWKRDIQVLPKRTHPDMNMNHGGGYILSGTVSKRGRWINLNQFRAEKGGPNLKQ